MALRDQREKRRLLTDHHALLDKQVVVPEGGAEPQEITLMAYGPDGFAEEKIENLESVTKFLKKWPVLWINVDGLGDLSVIKTFATLFDLHPLALEDVIHVNQRPKVEDYGDTEFIVARMATFNGGLETEQVSMFLSKGVVITFQELPGGDCLDPVRERIRKNRGQIRRAGTDYLVYSLLDAVVDGYFPVLEQYGETLESVEQEILERPSQHTIAMMHSIKRDLLTIRRGIWPMRDALNSMVRDESPLVAAETRVYLRDCYDHAVRIIDLVETYRELASDLMDVYLSSNSNRLNEVMKVLTIITTLFIPPSFIAGIYGMNFNPERSPFNMPELNWYFGYFFALSIMATLVIGLLVFLWRRGWLGARDLGSEERKAMRDSPESD